MREPLRPVRVEPRLPKWWEIGVVVTTVVSIANLAVGFGFADDDPRGLLVEKLDFAFCAILLADFAWRLAKSDRPLRFARRRLWDLIGAIPLVGPLRVLRVLRVLRILALLSRAQRSTGRALGPRGVSDIGAIALVAWLVAAAAIFLAEAQHNPQIDDFADALWWSMTTLSTVGYGDTYPASDAGRLIAGVTMVVGVGVLGTLAATIASWLVDLRDRTRQGSRRYSMRDHVLLLGWNDRSPAALDELRRELGQDDRWLCVVADLERCPVDEPQVRFVRGRATQRETLERASAATAAAAMIFAADPNDARSDHTTALVALALRRLSPSIRISAELVDGRNREHLEAAQCDGIIDASTIASSLLARALHDGGIADVVAELVTNSHGSEIYRVAVESRFVGATFRDYAGTMIERGACAIGLHRADANLLAPAPDTKLEAGDHAYVVAHDAERLKR
jgi:voltage-gated potassium channel